MYKKNTTSIIGIIITILILILIVIFSNMKEENKSFLEGTMSKIVMPIQNGLTYLKNKLAGNDSFFENLDSIKQENEELKKKNSELEESLRELEIIKSENEVLKEYMKMTEKYAEYSTVPANVINKDTSNYSYTIVINVGSNNGIQSNMAVISENGLVGYVLSVTDTTAKVQTIIDPASSVSANISTTRDTIVCRGILENTNKIRATYIPTEANLVIGDSIETSGMGGIYPKGIHIGTITEIKNTKNPIDRYALVETAVDFSKLETVLVVTMQNT